MVSAEGLSQGMLVHSAFHGPVGVCCVKCWMELK